MRTSNLLWLLTKIFKKKLNNLKYTNYQISCTEQFHLNWEIYLFNLSNIFLICYWKLQSSRWLQVWKNHSNTQKGFPGWRHKLSPWIRDKCSFKIPLRITYLRLYYDQFLKNNLRSNKQFGLINGIYQKFFSFCMCLIDGLKIWKKVGKLMLSIQTLPRHLTWSHTTSLSVNCIHMALMSIDSNRSSLVRCVTVVCAEEHEEQSAERFFDKVWMLYVSVSVLGSIITKYLV